jgi:hypothetical protein
LLRRALPKRLLLDAMPVYPFFEKDGTMDSPVAAGTLYVPGPGSSLSL